MSMGKVFSNYDYIASQEKGLNLFWAGSTILSPEIDWYPAEWHFYDIFGPFTPTEHIQV